MPVACWCGWQVRTTTAPSGRGGCSQPSRWLGADEGDGASGRRRLVAARLLAHEDDHIEVAHEALLTGWPRRRPGGRGRRRAAPSPPPAPAALEWAADGRPDDELLRGTRLEAAAEWVVDPDAGPTELEREYVEAGVALADAELRAARDRAEAEAAGHRRTRRFAAMLAGALVLALVATGLALAFQRRADDQATAAREAGTAADANRLAALSSSARALDVSLLLAAAAVQTADTPATRDGLLNALVEHRRATGVHQLGPEGVEETALSANGRTMLATQGRGGIVAWRTGSAEAPRGIASWWPESLAVSPDGRTLVAAAALSRTGVFSYTRDGTPGRSFRLPALGGYPRAVAFSRSGDLLVCMGLLKAGLRPALARIDLETGAVREREVIVRGPPGRARSTTAPSSATTRPRVVVHRTDRDEAWRVDVHRGGATRLDLARRDATGLELAPLPDGAAQLWSDGAITLYDAAGRASQELHAHRAPVRDVRVLPDGRPRSPRVTADRSRSGPSRPTVTGRSASSLTGTRRPSSRPRPPPTAGPCSRAPRTVSSCRGTCPRTPASERRTRASAGRLRLQPARRRRPGSPGGGTHPATVVRAQILHETPGPDTSERGGHVPGSAHRPGRGRGGGGRDRSRSSDRRSRSARTRPWSP